MTAINPNSLPKNGVPFAPATEQLEPLRIKDVVQIIFIALAAVFALLGIVGTTLYAFVPLISLKLINISLAALTVLGLVKLWERVTPYLPEPFRSIANHIYSFGTEIFSLLALFTLFPVDLTNWDPKTESEIDPGETPILLIHGFLGNSNNWIYHRSRLIAAGYKNIFTINLGNPLISTEEYATKVEEKIQHIKTLTKRDDIRLVCHSMGGLVAREWRYKHAKGTRVRDIVTMGTPLDGTYLAYLTLGISSCARQMFPGSSFVKEQQELASLETETNSYHIGTNVDLVTIPNRSAYHGGAPDHKTKIDILDSTGHVGYLFSDTAADLLIDYLNKKKLDN